MCKQCYNSSMGLVRRCEQEKAAQTFKMMRFNGYNDPEYLAANQRCIDAGKAMQQLHADYWMQVARETAQARNSFYVTYADKRGRQ